MANPFRKIPHFFVYDNQFRDPDTTLADVRSIAVFSVRDSESCRVYPEVIALLQGQGAREVAQGRIL